MIHDGNAYRSSRPLLPQIEYISLESYLCYFYSQVEIFQVKNYYTDNYFVDLGGIPKEQGRVGKGWEINTNFRTEKTIGEENQHLGSDL